MARDIGRLTKLGLGKETPRGTEKAPDFWIPVLDLGFDDRTKNKANEGGYGNIADAQGSQVVKAWADGDYSGKIQDKSVGIELTGVFGQSPVSVQRTTTGVYDHSFTMAQNSTHASLTIAKAESNFTARYPFGMVGSWSLEAEVGDFIRRTVSLMSKKGVSSSETPAYTDENEFVPRHMVVKLAAAGANDATIDAVTAAKMSSFTLDINKNVEEQMVFGSNEPDGFGNKQVEVGGRFVLFYDDRAYHTLAANNTHQACRVDMINTDTIIGTSGSHNPALRFTMPEIVLEYPEISFDNNDVKVITVNYKAVLNLATGAQITARVTNAYAGTAY